MRCRLPRAPASEAGLAVRAGQFGAQGRGRAGQRRRRARSRGRGALVVRVNAASASSCLRDIEAAVAAGADAIMLPKAKTAAETGAVCWALDQLEAGQDRTIELVPLVETARGLRDVDRIPWGARVRQLAFGTIDYALELGLEGPAGEEAVAHARHALVAASRVAGLQPPIDGVGVDGSCGIGCAKVWSLEIKPGGRPRWKLRELEWIRPSMCSRCTGWMRAGPRCCGGTCAGGRLRFSWVSWRRRRLPLSACGGSHHWTRRITGRGG